MTGVTELLKNGLRISWLSYFLIKWSNECENFSLKRCLCFGLMKGKIINKHKWLLWG